MQDVTVAPVTAEGKEKQLPPSCLSLLWQEVRDSPHAEHKTHPVICHHMLLTKVLDLGIHIVVLLSSALGC